jgi:hypothetical protein
MMSAPASAKASRKWIDRRDHQVDVERLGRMRAERFDHRRADRDVGDEMAVHHVDVDPVGPGRVDRADLLAQAGEIGGQDRRGDEGTGHATG